MNTTTSNVRVNITRTTNLKYLLHDHKPVPVHEARKAWAQFRQAHGLKYTTPPLLSEPSANLKLDKTQAYGLSLAPARLSGYNTCTHSTPACRRICLNTAGKGAYSSVQKARMVKTRFLYEHPHEFVSILMHELQNLYSKYGKDLRVRLNVLSDIPWESVFPDVFLCAPRARFYDYTKDWERLFVDQLPNYTLAASAHERTQESDVAFMVNMGFDVAVVFDTPAGKPLPHVYAEQHVTDADKTDAWMLMRPRTDGRGRIGGLRAKGRARTDRSGFVKTTA